MVSESIALIISRRIADCNASNQLTRSIHHMHLVTLVCLQCGDFFDYQMPMHLEYLGQNKKWKHFLAGLFCTHCFLCNVIHKYFPCSSWINASSTCLRDELKKVLTCWALIRQTDPISRESSSVFFMAFFLKTKEALKMSTWILDLSWYKIGLLVFNVK